MKIAVAGVAIGLAVMIITVCVILGFKHTIRDKVVGFGSHIQIVNIMSYQYADTYPVFANDSLRRRIQEIPGVRHAERFSITKGILKTETDFLGIAFKGIAQDYDKHFIESHLVAGKLPTFSDSTTHYQLLISQPTADKLNLNVNDKVFAYFVNNDDIRMRKYTICGIYQTNMTKYDESLCFTDLYAVNKLNGWKSDQCSGIEVLVNDFDQLNTIEEAVEERIDDTSDSQGNTLSSNTILQANPNIFTWLDLLDLNVWIILALMVCVAGFTMISGLLIIILERTQMIGILKAVGARNSTIRSTFLWFSVFIISKGLLIGNLLGIGIVVLQQTTGFVTLDPKTYYVSEAPMELNIPIILLLNIVTLIVNILVLIAPSYLVSHIQPAKSIRYE
jgi:lipoprotein-releasing system permease protein